MSQRHARTQPASRQTGRFCDRGLDCMLNLAIDTGHCPAMSQTADHQAVLRPLSNIRRLSLLCLCLLVHRDTYSLTVLASWSWQTCTAAPLSIRGAPTRHSGIAEIAPCKADTRLGSHNMPQPRSPARLFICAFMPRNELLPVPCALLSSGVVGAPFTIP